MVSGYRKLLLLMVVILAFAGNALADGKLAPAPIVLGQSCALTGPSKNLGLELRGGLLAALAKVNDENGGINMPYVGAIEAGGKTSTGLEQAIQKAYIDQQIYKTVTVNVVVPSRSYYVRGEIKQPGRFLLMSRVTVVQAIAAAGGFTEFANHSKVEILRGNQRIRVDVDEIEKHPDRDRELESGDVIIVHRSFF